MTMGEYIKELRTGGNKYGKVWTQEELGQALNPKVNRAAVNKWESGRVENLKRTHIEQLAKLFDVEPFDLMCFEFDVDEDRIAKEVRAIEKVQDVFGEDAVQLLQGFMKLNEVGKYKILNEIDDLAEISKYSK